MLKADGRSTEHFIRSAFDEAGKKWDMYKVRHMILGVKDLGQSYAAHRELVAHFCGKERRHLARSRSKISPARRPG